MPVKIRLQRQGKKGKPYFHIVVADARASRDGKYIERLGMYNPNTNPATIEVNVDGAIQWLGNGAIPTDTARAILSYKGVLYKNHLLKGVKKGAITEDQANEKFTAWLEEKEGKVESKRGSLSSAQEKDRKERLAAEAEVNKKREAAIAAANAPAPVEEAPAEGETTEASAETTENTETATEEVKAEEVTSEEAKTEEPKEEVKAEETKAEETKVEEPKAETPTEDEPKAETPAVDEEPKAETPAVEEEPVAESEDLKADADETDESPEAIAAEEERVKAIQKEKEEPKDK